MSNSQAKNQTKSFLRRRFAEAGGGRTGGKIRAFLEMLDELTLELPGRSIDQIIGRILDRSGYLAALEKEGSPESEARIENLRELIGAADDFSRANAGHPDEERSELDFFLDQVALVSDLDSYDRRDD